MTIGSAVYNVDETFLRAHIENVMRQLTDETEFLLIDDCSTDDSGEICKQYAEKDDRVRYIRMEKNGGLSCVRNRTIREAAGKWILFADGDDLISDHFVGTALSFYDADQDVIIYDRLKFFGDKGEEEPCGITELAPLPKEAGRDISLSCLCLMPRVPQKYKMTNRSFFHAAWGALYRREFLLENDLLFPEGQKKAQDSVFNTEVYFKAEKIAYLPYVMYYYRKNQQGITQRYSADFPEMARAIITNQRACIQKLYPGEEEVEQLYKENRMISLAIDSMRLNYFHSDNPNPREKRKEDFLAFVASEPYKSAIDDFDAKKSGRFEWAYTVALAKKKKFAKLDYLFKHEKLFRLLQGIDSRLKKTF